MEIQCPGNQISLISRLVVKGDIRRQLTDSLIFNWAAFASELYSAGCF
jgi:hypothetical protein